MYDGNEPVVGLLLEIQRNAAAGLQEQLESALREHIRSGRLRAGARLPSSRALSAQLSLSRGVISAAYGQLAAEGYLNTRQGAPVTVARTVRSAASSAPVQALQPSLAYDFSPTLPDLSAFPRERWMRSLRAAWRESPLDAVGYGDPRGAPTLREQLAGYLGRVRGAAADPEHVLVCGGFAQGFALICRWLREHGVDALAVEDPGFHPHRLTAEQNGLELVAIPVDDEGLDVEALRASDARAVLVTAAHQFPTGANLSRARRAALIEWAEHEQALVIEDDYDTELRYDRVTIGALQGLAPERVVLIGSASKRLVPGMRLGWMLTPSWLAWSLIAAKTIEDAGSEIIGQLALSDFIARGELDRHLKRMRLLYPQHRQALLRAVRELLPCARVRGSAAGLFELLEFDAQLDERRLVADAAARGVGVEGLAHHRFLAGGAPGIVLGYGNLAPAAIEHGVRLLGDALKAQ